MMKKLQLCRICLAINVPMYIVVNKNLHELYEKLTDIPFVTADRRPILACFFCCAKLKQCFRLMRKCLEAEEIFTQMIDEDYEPNPSINLEHLGFCSGFIRTPIEHISIVDKCQTENIFIKEEPADCEGLDDSKGNLSDESIDIKEELPAVRDRLYDIKEDQSDDLEPENVDNIYLGVEAKPPHHSESDSEGDVPLIVIKTEGKEAIDVSKKIPRAVETNSAPATRTTKLEDTITAELKKKEPSSLKVFRTTGNHMSKPGTSSEEPDECDQRICKKTYKCDVCRRSFNLKCDLKAHIRVHTSEKPYKCGICQRSFCQSNHLIKHIRIHTGEKPYKCDLCHRSFTESGSLTKHIRIHTGEKPYKCDVCQRGFSESGSLRKHFVRIHNGEKPYKCDVCQRTFSERSSLRKHFQIHTGEKPYNCDVCQRSFSQRCELTKHLRIHTGEKPYKCDVCERSFTLKGTLTKHIRTHTGEKPFKCDVCGRSYCQKTRLNNHILKHTTAKSQ